MSTNDAMNKKPTNVMVLLETLERCGDLDADQLEERTGIKKAIIVSTLFLAKKRQQISSRPKNLVALEGRFEFSTTDEQSCKQLSRCGWEIPEIADRLGMSETYVETMLFVASAPKEVREMVEKGMVDTINAVQTMKEAGDRAVESLLAMLGAAPKADGKKCATKGQVYHFLTYKGMKISETEQEPQEPKIDFAAQIADFFTRNARKAITLYDSRCASRYVNLENFRGGAGANDGGRHWQDSVGTTQEARQ
ncbi:KorB domain-containing protein [Ottowia sp.]|uniref:KorB domain-containing protein n=1 Tax=Ottowia sp. TaxID=1898956 RepID=UPI0025EBB94C|nr:KorB domain-containing protein [Ottowia sp.]MBK6616108.1 hypothetical protein [Ottowia sp.]